MRPLSVLLLLLVGCDAEGPSESPPPDAAVVDVGAPDAGATEELRRWLRAPAGERPPIAEQAFAAAPLSREAAAEAEVLLWEDRAAALRESRRAAHG